MPERRFFHFTATRADAVLFAALLIAFLLALCARNPLDDSRFAPVHEAALSGVVATGEGRGKIDINAADAALPYASVKARHPTTAPAKTTTR